MRPRTRLILMVIGLSLLLAASAQAGPLFGQIREIDITMGEKNCDGIHLWINYNTGIVVAKGTGCCKDDMWGTVGAVLDGTYRGGAVTLMNPTNVCGEGVPYYIVILDVPKIWVTYGVGGVKLKSGAYVLGPPLP
jgi:hypothetical protein